MKRLLFCCGRSQQHALLPRLAAIYQQAKMGTPHLATSKGHGQEGKSRSKLAKFYLAIYLGLLTRFSVPLRLKPLQALGKLADVTGWTCSIDDSDKVQIAKKTPSSRDQQPVEVIHKVTA